MAGLFLCSGSARYFSDGQKREIHSVSVLRKIPMHGGGSDLAAGLNHVMRGPGGSESLSERMDFTPKGRERREVEPNEGDENQVVLDLPSTRKKKKNSRKKKKTRPLHIYH